MRSHSYKQNMTKVNYFDGSTESTSEYKLQKEFFHNKKRIINKPQ